jgi:hypothetical protein
VSSEKRRVASGWAFVVMFYLFGGLLCVKLYQLAQPPQVMGDDSYRQPRVEANLP